MIKIKKLLTISLMTMVIFTFSLFFLVGTSMAVTVSVWDREATTEKAVEIFNQKMEEEGRDIRAEFSLVPYGEQISQFMAALSAGNAPDVIGLDIPQYPYFADIGAFIDITERAQELPYFDDFPKGLIDIGSKDGKIYGLPAVLDLSGLIWNKDMFKEAGLDPNSPPETWAELIEYGQALTKDTNNDGNTDQWGFAVAGGSGGAYMFWFGPFIWGNNGNILNEAGTEVLFNSPETIEAIELWADSIHKYNIAPENSVHWGSGDRYNAFISGNLGMFLSGNFNITTIKEDAPDLDFGTTYIPRAEDGEHASFAGGNLIGITTQSEHPDAAWEFIKFYQSEAVQVEIIAKGLNLPNRPSLFNNPYFEEIPQMREFADLLAVSRVPYSFKYNELYDPLEFYMEETLLGDLSPEEAAKKIDAEMSRIIE